MFNLTDELINSVEIRDKEYEINAAFDNILRISELFNRPDFSSSEKLSLAVIYLIGESVYYDLDLTLEEEQEILTETYGEITGINSKEEKSVEVDLLGNPMPKRTGDPNEEDVHPEERVFDVEQDAAYVYASFMQDYGIDLIDQQGKLHYSKYHALLTGLTSETKLSQVIEIRTMELPKNDKSGKQRAKILKAKEHYKLK